MANASYNWCDPHIGSILKENDKRFDLYRKRDIVRVIQGLLDESEHHSSDWMKIRILASLETIKYRQFEYGHSVA